MSENDLQKGNTDGGEEWCDDFGTSDGDWRDADWGAPGRPTRTDHATVLGSLVLHTTHRDIELHVDGAAAFEVLFTYAGNARTVDFLDPDFNPTENAILAIDFSSIVALTWTPCGGGRSPDREMIVGRRV